MTQRISLTGHGLIIAFIVRESGVVELERFAPASDERGSSPVLTVTESTDDDMPEPDHPARPIIELQVTGKSTRELHGYKHNASSASWDLCYAGHTLTEQPCGEELLITLESSYGLKAFYHMQFYRGAPVVRVFTEIRNTGTREIPVEYISSFIYQNLCGEGTLPYQEKTDIYVPRSSWYCEARWQKEDIELLNLSRMLEDGYRAPGFGNNRFAYSGVSSWSSAEYLPMGIAHDRERNDTFCFQVESSGQWLIEYDTEQGRSLAVALSGPTEQEHGWWISLKAGQSFTTVPAAFGAVRGGISEAVGALTRYRRAMRRPGIDDGNLPVVFNDYMNCLEGDPTEENEKAIIDRAARMGCEYYCLDAGWYDKGFWWDRVGEWKESRERFPGGLKAVCDYAVSRGMVMGLWVEIEVMGVECALAKTLPDNWFICRHGHRHIDHGRYLLDFRNPQVRSYCRGVIERLISDYGVGYFKIDYNVTMGCGSDLDTDSCSGAILDHYRALYAWYEEIFEAHPDLVIENCGSGGMRMDYGMLRLLNLQSTSDQTDYLYNAYIASSVASAAAPEQCGMWVYPYEDDKEHVIFNMVNGLLLRPYMSGMVWKLGEESMRLLAEGISLYKRIRKDVRQGLPFFPLGFNTIKDEVLAYGLMLEDHAYLLVFAVGTGRTVIPLETGDRQVVRAEVIYPAEGLCEFSLDDNTLTVQMPQRRAARLFRLTMKNMM